LYRRKPNPRRSKNAVAADTVAAALMGFDADAPSRSYPFSYADHHLLLAHEAGLGTNRLSEIEVLGANISAVIFPFKPVR
jgi:hypothetical protein